MEDASDRFDVVIVGGGPAGMSAALWCSDVGLTSILIEKNEGMGGQLVSVHNPIPNYLGHRFENGREALRSFASSLEGAAFDSVCGIPVSEIDVEPRSVELADGRRFRGRSIILATGLRRRVLDVPGIAEFVGRGMLTSGVAEKQAVLGKHVLIVGGGDAALENAIILSEFAKEVTIVHRRDHFTARPEFLGQIQDIANISVMFDATLVSINGDSRLETVTVRSSDYGETDIQTDFVLVRIGVIPNSELVVGKLATDEAGYVAVDSCGRTSKSDIYAVGDLANPRSPTISTAVGTAATAIKSLEPVSI